MSKRLQAAAVAEIARLQKRRERLGARFAPLVAEDEELAERIELLRAAAGLNAEVIVPAGGSA